MTVCEGKNRRMELKISEILEAVNGSLLTGDREMVALDVSIDSRKTMAGNLFIPLQGTQSDGHMFIKEAFKHGARAALIRQGNPIVAELTKTHPHKIMIEVDDPLKSLGDIAHYWRGKFNTKIVAITGSNGKTTTKEMAWHIIADTICSIKNPGNWNNLIGLPLSLFQLNGSRQAAILEMGMSEIGEIRRLCEISGPQTGLITNIGPAHLEQLNSLDEIRSAKGELLQYLGRSDIAILNNDDFRVASLAESTLADVVSFGVAAGDIHTSNIRNYNCFGTAFELHVMGASAGVQLKLIGKQFISNVLAAASIAHTLGIDIEGIKKGLETFPGLQGRMEAIDLGGIRIINDAYNANPVSMQAALNLLSSITGANRKIAVLGDMLELGKQSELFHRQLGETVAQLDIDCLFLTGDFAGFVQEGAVSAGMDGNNIILSKDLKNLAAELKEKMSKGDSILLKGSRRMGMEKVVEFLHCGNSGR